MRNKVDSKVMVSVAMFAMAAATGGNTVCAEVDMRIPKACYLSAVVDFDAIRAEASVAAGMVRDGIAKGGRSGNIPHAEAALTNLNKVSAWFDEVKRECGVAPDDIHWLVMGVRNKRFWIRRDLMQTQFVFGVAMSVDRMDWKRIESYTTAKGFRWNDDGECSHNAFSRTVSWFSSTGYLAGMLAVVVGDDGMVYSGNDGFMRLAYSGMGEVNLDDRPSRRGKLENGEVVRVVLTDVRQIPIFGARAVNSPPPYGAMVAKSRECRLSLFWSNDKVRARLQTEFTDSATANEARKLLWNEFKEDGKKSTAESLARAREKNAKEDVELYETLLAWERSLSITADGNRLTVDTGLIDARQVFDMIAKPLAEDLLSKGW